MSLSPRRVVKGETRTILIQVKETGVAKDITGLTFKYAAKEKITDTVYKINAVDGVIVDAAQGKVSFTVLFSTVFSGVEEIAMYGAGPTKTVLTPAGGNPVRVIEDIID